MKHRARVAAVLAAGAAMAACNVLLGNEDGVFVRGDAAVPLNEAGTIDDGAAAADAEETDAAIVDAFVNTGCDARPNDDPLNCGACGHDCQGGDCRTGKCLPAVISADAGAAVNQRMAMSDEGIYIIAGGTVHRVGLDGGAASTIHVPSGGNVLTDIAASPSKVVFTEAFGTKPSVRSCPFGPSACPDAAVVSDAIVDPHDLSLVGERAFWTDLTLLYASPPAGGAPELFRNEDVTGTTASPTRIYWGRQSYGGIHSAFPDGGGFETIVADSGTSISTMAITDTALVWVVNKGTFTLFVATPDGGAPRSVTGIPTNPVRVGIAGDQVYWLENANRVLRRCPLQGPCSGGEAVSVQRTADFAITQRAIWWVEEGGRILRLAR